MPPTKHNEHKGDMMRSKIIIVGIIGLFALTLVLSCFSVVRPGHRGIMVTLGHTDTVALQPGPHLKLPFVSTIIPMSVRVNKYSVGETAQSLDLQHIQTTIAVNFHVEPKDVSWVYTHIGTESTLTEKVLSQRVSKVFKAVIAKYNAEELTQHRDRISTMIQNQLSSELLPYRTLIDGVNITNFTFTQQFQAAIERKQIALQKAQQASYELDRAKIKAQQKIVQAQAEQKAIALVQSALTKNYVQYQAIKRWDGKLPHVMAGQGLSLLFGDKSTK